LASSPEIVRLPLLDPLIPGGIRPGTMLLVEYDPESQWFAVASTIAARYLAINRHVGYLAMARPSEDFKQRLTSLGVDIAAAGKEGRLAVEDWYSASLTGGRLEPTNSQAAVFEMIKGELKVRSLKVSDLSIEWLKTSKVGPRPAYDVVDYWPVASLIICESLSSVLRFNEEKAYVEFMESRVFPEERRRKSITLQALARGLHTDWLYKRMEGAMDAVIDLQVMEREGEIKNMLRIRSLRDQPHDTRWHELQINSNGEASLVA
jgi:KaiC/GvpD/RAD55 family RecA-like ATPase